MRRSSREAVRGSSDAELLTAVRERGESSAFDELYRRHVDAARGAAWKIAPGLDGDDLVSEAFTRILRTLRNGSGPRDLLRPYLYQVIRRVAVEQAPVPHANIDDQHALADPASLEGIDEASARRELVSDALAGMPERWRAVLWYAEVEGYAPREIAPLLGITAVHVSQIRSRARKRLHRNLGIGTASLGLSIAVPMVGAPTAQALWPGLADPAGKTGAATLLTLLPAKAQTMLVAGGLATAAAVGVVQVVPLLHTAEAPDTAPAVAVLKIPAPLEDAPAAILPPPPTAAAADPAPSAVPDPPPTSAPEPAPVPDPDPVSPAPVPDPEPAPDVAVAKKDGMGDDIPEQCDWETVPVDPAPTIRAPRG